MAAGTECSGAPARPSLVLATCILASSLAFVDGSVVNVGLTAIGRSLRAEGPALQWVVNAYLLPLSALLLFGGAMSDRYGRRRLLIVGTLLFAVASVVCAAAPDLRTLLAGRFGQGLGAALLMPSSLAILGAQFEGAAKGRAIGIWAATGAAMGAIGPVLGGWIIDQVGWRSIFFINLPLAIAALALAWRYVPADRASGRRRLDGMGALVVTLGLAIGTWALSAGSSDGWSALPSVGGVVALAMLGLFIAIEKRLGEEAMMPLVMFLGRTFVGLTLLTALIYGSLGALFLLLPFVLIQSAHYSATAAGAALMPLPLILAIGSPAMGALAGRIGPRLPLTIGSCVVGLGFVMMLRIGEAAPFFGEVLPAIVVIALGMSGAVAPLTTAVLSSVDERHVGSASGFNSAVARTGGLIATALIGPLLIPGGRLVSGFHLAAVVGAVACGLAAVAAFTLVASSVPDANAQTGRRS